MEILNYRTDADKRDEFMKLAETLLGVTPKETDIEKAIAENPPRTVVKRGAPANPEPVLEGAQRMSKLSWKIEKRRNHRTRK